MKLFDLYFLECLLSLHSYFRIRTIFSFWTGRVVWQWRSTQRSRYYLILPPIREIPLRINCTCIVVEWLVYYQSFYSCFLHYILLFIHADSSFDSLFRSLYFLVLSLIFSFHWKRIDLWNGLFVLRAKWRKAILHVWRGRVSDYFYTETASRSFGREGSTYWSSWESFHQLALLARWYDVPRNDVAKLYWLVCVLTVAQPSLTDVGTGISAHTVYKDVYLSPIRFYPDSYVKSFSISPALPDGLSFDESLGVINGTYHGEVGSSTVYTVTAVGTDRELQSEFTLNFKSKHCQSVSH